MIAPVCLAHGDWWIQRFQSVLCKSTARIQLAEVFHPWARVRGLDLDLRVRPVAAAPLMHWNEFPPPPGPGWATFSDPWIVYWNFFPRCALKKKKLMRDICMGVILQKTAISNRGHVFTW